MADFGCGTGYFSIPVAEIIGENGMLYSLDILPQALESIKSQSKIKGISNIKTKRVNLELKNGSGLENGSVDWVIIKNILFQNKDKKAILDEAKRILKSDGNVLIMEWNDKETNVGPKAELRLTQEEIEKLLESSGFSVENKFKAGDFHYVLVAGK